MISVKSKLGPPFPSPTNAVRGSFDSTLRSAILVEERCASAKQHLKKAPVGFPEGRRACAHRSSGRKC